VGFATGKQRIERLGERALERWSKPAITCFIAGDRRRGISKPDWPPIRVSLPLDWSPTCWTS